MWQTVELREIRVFLTLTEELHFGRTAERLGLTQSRVSQTLRALERSLGDRLVDRTSRRVTLTPAGERLTPSWIPLTWSSSVSLSVFRAPIGWWPEWYGLALRMLARSPPAC